MPGYSVTYGGKHGQSYNLAVSNQQMVVRTHHRVPIGEAGLSTRAKKILEDMHSVTYFPDAGVEVFSLPGTKAAALSLRNKARTALKKESPVQFAGRVLTDRAGVPAVYTENLFIKFNHDVKASRCKSIVKEFDLLIKRPLEYARNAFFAQAPDGMGLNIFALAQKLLKHEHVMLCHPELARPLARRGAFVPQWHLKKTILNGQTINAHANVVPAWAHGKGEGVIIAVIDDGVDMSHEEFIGKIVHPRDVSRRNNNPTPGNGDNHGTACAGVACANGRHGASGVAPKAKLMPIRHVSALGTQPEADAFVWAADHGADVISCSWGPQDGRWWDPNDPQHNAVVPLPDSTRLAIDYAVNQGRNGRGCVITWAAGNGNEPVDNDGYASYEKVIAVGACGHRNKRSLYSDTGRALWCCFPSNQEPGNPPGIWTTDRSGSVGYNDGDSNLGDPAGHYTNDFGGTSSACPGAAGVAALILGRQPDFNWQQVKDAMKNSCDQIDTAGGNYDASGHSQQYGFGRLNAARAVEVASPPQPTYVAVHTAIQDVAIEDHKTKKLSVKVGDTKNLLDLEVVVDIDHTYVGDLLVKLNSPTASSVTLHEGVPGDSTDNLKKTYSQATTPALADLVGQKPQGTWTLSVKDRASADVGVIRSFSLRMSF